MALSENTVTDKNYGYPKKSSNSPGLHCGRIKQYGAIRLKIISVGVQCVDFTSITVNMLLVFYLDYRSRPLSSSIGRMV